MLHVKHITEEGVELDIIRQLFRDYEKELDENLCFQSFEAELKEPLKKYGPPSGDLLLAYWENEPRNFQVAGCIALTKMNEEGACEMKRLYVKPGFRKNKIGKILVDELLHSAKEKGYATMRLDTLTKLQPAISLYENYGFRNISAYYHNPLPGVVYMEKEL
ncbi:MAG: GNAT family N-acetyltransferase [Chitinophagaceae bacterium]|nr:MAG: GNAT family N-acetyltransferase [Chitinophagaceae bacterium]